MLASTFVEEKKDVHTHTHTHTHNDIQQLVFSEISNILSNTKHQQIMA